MGPNENGSARLHYRLFQNWKAKKKRNEEKSCRIEQLNELLAQSAQCKNNTLLRIKIQSTQMLLKRITDQKVNGAILRSKARWVEYGEKNTRYFQNLEKKKGEKKNIIKLKLKDETETEDQEIILREEENFYRALYQLSNINIETPENKTGYVRNRYIGELSDSFLMLLTLPKQSKHRASPFFLSEFESMNKALKASWVRRFNTEVNAPSKIIPNYMTRHLGCWRDTENQQ